MGKETVQFGEKSDLYKEHTKLFNIEDINPDMIEISLKKKMTKKRKGKKKSSFKYYIGYNDNNRIVPLIISLPQSIGYYSIFKDGKTMNFICDDKEIFKKYKEIWEKN